jgi:iron complex outermembrane recepter protein
MKRTLCMSTSVLALVCCSAAYAQTASPGSTTTTTYTGKVEEVVVTAERRSVSLQKSNIAATVLTGQDLSEKGVNVVDNLQFIAPSVTVDNFGQGIDFDIRGIGKGEHNSQTTPGVITYRDGVATFPGYITEEPYFDVSSLEILRGPQGTFAGQNAIGGAVFLTTNNPVIGGGYDGYALAQVGNYTDFGTQGAVNLPIDDTMAARFAWFGETRNSFYDITEPNGSKYTGNPGNARWGAGRFSFLWEPNQALTILFKTDFGLLDNGAYPADPFVDRFKFYPGTTIPNPSYTDLFHITASQPQQAQDEYVRSSVKVDYVFGGGITLQSISAFQKGNTAYKADLYGTPDGGFVDNVDETIWSEEVNLISPDKGWFTWVLGAFAQSDDYDFLPPAYKNFVIGVPPGSPFSEYALQGTNPESDLSAFGQVSFNLPAGFQIQLGGRYSDVSTQNKNVDIYQYGLFLLDDQTLKDTNFSYKAALNWNVNDDNLLYAFIATGFKPGGLNVPVGIGIPAPFIPETDTDYEAGWKSTFFDGHLRTQLDGYWNDFKDFQVTIAYPDFPTFPFEVNVPGKTKIYGAEGSAQAVFGAFAFDVGVGLEHSSIGTFYSADPRFVLTTAPCNPQTGPATFACNNLTGHQQTYAPSFTFDLGAQYTFDLGDGDALTPRADFGHQSAQWATLFEDPDLGDRLGQRNILSAQLSWIRGDWNVTLYGTNLTNQHYVEALNSGLDFAGPPRQFGVRLTKTF